MPIGRLRSKIDGQPSAVGQRAADERTDGDRRAHLRRAPQAQRRAALERRGTPAASSAERRREHRRAADALRAARRISVVALGASAHSSDATVKHTRPTAKTSRRPSMSASEPAVSSSAASVSASSSMTPLHLAEARPELLGDRQRDVHDRDVEQQHERRQADGEQGPPFALHRRRLRSGGGGSVAERAEITRHINSMSTRSASNGAVFQHTLVPVRCQEHNIKRPRRPGARAAS